MRAYYSAARFAEMAAGATARPDGAGGANPRYRGAYDALSEQVKSAALSGLESFAQTDLLRRGSHGR